MEKQINILDLAKFILLYHICNDLEITHLKLQKILYYIQAYHLAYFPQKLIFEELPEAWVNGPVYKSVWNSLKENGPIKSRIGIINNDDELAVAEFQKTKERIILNKAQWEFLEAALHHYSKMPHEKLVFMTHTDAPWNIAREGLDVFDYSNNIISKESMFQFYNDRIQKRKEKSI